MEKIALPVIICCMLFSAQDLWAQEFGLQTTPNPKISTYVDMLNDERVTGPFYGPVKSIRTSSNYYGYLIWLSRDVYKGKQEMARHIESDQSEYSFSKNGNLSSLQVNYKLKVDYFTDKYKRMSEKTWDELQKEKNWSSKVFDGTVSYKFANGKLAEKKDTVARDVKKEVLCYDSLGRVISCYRDVVDYYSFMNTLNAYASHECFSYNADGLLNRHYQISIREKDTSRSGLEYFVYSNDLITKRFVYNKSIYTFIEDQPVYRHYFYLSVLDYDTLSNGNVVSDTRVLFYEMNLSEDEERRIYFDDDLVASLIDSVYEKGENHVWREDRCRTRDVWTIPYNIGHCTYDSLNHILQWKNEYRDFSRVENTMATMRYDEKGRLIEAIAEEGLFKQPLKDWMKKVVRQRVEYDDYGNLLLFEWYEKDKSEPSNQRRYEYEYDAYGNWVSRKCYLDGELKSDEKRMIKYW